MSICKRRKIAHLLRLNREKTKMDKILDKEEDIPKMKRSERNKK